MEKWQIIALLLIGVCFVVGSVLLRVFSQGKYEIKTIDLTFIVVPLLLAGLATGKLRGLDLFGVKADLSELWAKAADTQIEQQVSTVPISPVNDAIEMIETAEKRGVNEIPRLIKERTQALAFHLGMGGVLRTGDQKVLRQPLRQFLLTVCSDQQFGRHALRNLQCGRSHCLSAHTRHDRLRQVREHAEPRQCAGKRLAGPTTGFCLCRQSRKGRDV